MDAIILTLGHGALGFSDDFIKAVKRRNLGLTAKQKITRSSSVSNRLLRFQTL